MTPYLRPLALAVCFVACVFAVAEAIAHAGYSPFESLPPSEVSPTSASLAPAFGGDAAHQGETR